MKREIRKLSSDGKKVQITVADTERWYMEEIDGEVKAYPSVTWITSCYPKGIAFYKWLAEKGWDESQAIVADAGARGHKVHEAITMLLNGKTVSMDERLLNTGTEELEELTLEEYEALLSFKDWYDKTKPENIHNEIFVKNEEIGYAGTVDLYCHIDGKPWIIDFKTSQSIWPSHELQVAAYKHAGRKNEANLGILQLGYRRNKNKWKFTQVDDKFELFEAAYKIWQNENPRTKPFAVDLPTSIDLGISIKKFKEKK